MNGLASLSTHAPTSLTHPGKAWDPRQPVRMDLKFLLETLNYLSSSAQQEGRPMSLWAAGSPPGTAEGRPT